uniref:(northern house mosquito) hypothetical protein n=1 Tax=Culex pipiens TaxID=7175 RepID=A0A8D8PJE0_CULPI
MHGLAKRLHLPDADRSDDAGDDGPRSPEPVAAEKLPRTLAGRPQLRRDALYRLHQELATDRYVSRGDDRPGPGRRPAQHALLSGGDRPATDYLLDHRQRSEREQPERVHLAARHVREVYLCGPAGHRRARLPAGGSAQQELLRLLPPGRHRAHEGEL